MAVPEKLPSLVSREAVKEATDAQHTPVSTTKMADPSDKEAGTAAPSEDAQAGVQKMQAITIAWTKPTLALFLILYVYPAHPLYTAPRI